MTKNFEDKPTELEKEAQRRKDKMLAEPRKRVNARAAQAAARAVRADVEEYIREYNVPFITV